MMKLNSITLGVLVVAMIFGGIGLSTAMNWWQTESSKTPAVFTNGEYAGLSNPADIRSSYTFGDVNKNFGIPLDELARAFRLPVGMDVASFSVKNLESIYVDLPVEMGTASVRLFAAFYNGLPYDLTTAGDTYLFTEAAQILMEHNKMQPDQAAFLQTHIVPDAQVSTFEMTQMPNDDTSTQPVVGVTPTEHVAPDMMVTGATTFQNLLDWGVSQETIETILGNAMPAPQTLIKDYAIQLGQTFSTLKTAFQAEVDKLK